MASFSLRRLMGNSGCLSVLIIRENFSSSKMSAFLYLTLQCPQVGDVSVRASELTKDILLPGMFLPDFLLLLHSTQSECSNSKVTTMYHRSHGCFEKFGFSRDEQLRSRVTADTFLQSTLKILHVQQWLNNPIRKLLKLPMKTNF